RWVLMAAHFTSADDDLPAVHAHLARERVLPGCERRQVDVGRRAEPQVCADVEVGEYDLLGAGARVATHEPEAHGVAGGHPDAIRAVDAVRDDDLDGALGCCRLVSCTRPPEP